MKKTIVRKLLGVWNSRTIIAVLIGAVLFGVLINYGAIRVTTNTSLTTAYVIPAVIGALFGPLPAALSAGLGNVVADLLGGWGLWFDWSAGNFVAGFFAGLGCVYGSDVENGVFGIRHAFVYCFLCIAGCAVGFGLVTPFLTYLWYADELIITWIQAQAAIISDASVLIIIGLPVLYLLAKRNAGSKEK